MATPRGIYKPDGSTVVDIVEIVGQVADTTDAAIGNAINGAFKVASATVTVTSGVATVPHALGRVPVFDGATLSTADFIVAVTARTDTNLTLQVKSVAGVNYTGSITVRWFVA